MRLSSINSPQHWRERAEEIRTLVADVKDEFAKQKMLQIAEDYERLAKRVEERAHRRPNQVFRPFVVGRELPSS